MAEKSKRLGERGEDAAAAFLERAGMEIVERNWRVPTGGEVDIVALDGEEVVLVEVKTRKSTAKGSPEEAVTVAKQRRYKRLAKAYQAHMGTVEVPLRFDVITIIVLGEDRALLRHYRSAFVVDMDQG